MKLLVSDRLGYDDVFAALAPASQTLGRPMPPKSQACCERAAPIAPRAGLPQSPHR